MVYCPCLGYHGYTLHYLTHPYTSGRWLMLRRGLIKATFMNCEFFLMIMKLWIAFFQLHWSVSWILKWNCCFHPSIQYFIHFHTSIPSPISIHLFPSLPPSIYSFVQSSVHHPFIVVHRIVKVRENRLSLLISHIMVGLSLFMLPTPLNYIPSSVLDGLFLFVAITPLFNSQMFERFLLLVTEQVWTLLKKGVGVSHAQVP